MYGSRTSGAPARSAASRAALSRLAHEVELGRYRALERVQQRHRLERRQLGHDLPPAATRSRASAPGRQRPCAPAPGRWTLTTTDSPVRSRARCTCPIDAAASGVGSKAANARVKSSPSAARSWRSTTRGFIGGTPACSDASAPSRRAGKRSSRVARSCPSLMKVARDRPARAPRARPMPRPVASGRRRSSSSPKPWRNSTAPRAACAAPAPSAVGYAIPPARRLRGPFTPPSDRLIAPAPTARRPPIFGSAKPGPGDGLFRFDSAR